MLHLLQAPTPRSVRHWPGATSEQVVRTKVDRSEFSCAYLRSVSRTALEHGIAVLYRAVGLAGPPSVLPGPDQRDPTCLGSGRY
mmetsp:Transcript_6376/g.8907  ORF Transcript_6376/g.8907 Transcript_6376/m.8907 type:complete len:84 (-) Transcript_6376:66-317(-)